MGWTGRKAAGGRGQGFRGRSRWNRMDLGRRVSLQPMRGGAVGVGWIRLGGRQGRRGSGGAVDQEEVSESSGGRRESRRASSAASQRVGWS
jgi:hypothetical protein